MPSEDMSDEREAVLGALDAVIGSFEASLDAAEAGDRDRFDREEARNQDENLPAMESAFHARKVSGAGSAYRVSVARRQRPAS